MRRTFTTVALCLVSFAAMAVPAKKVWKTVKQPDGTSIEVALVGNERNHYYITRDGAAVMKTADEKVYYLKQGNGGLEVSNTLAHEATQRNATEKACVLMAGNIRSNTLNRVSATGVVRKSPKRLPSRDDKSIFQGKKKAPVILAYFTDKNFSESDSSIVKTYNNILNQVGYSEHGAPGSVHDYFTDMSRGQFDLTFDVFGPIKVSKSATYYGGPSALYGGTDHAGEFATEAIKKANELCNIQWKDYDWDGDGEVEQVFILYAGYGQATGGPTGTIWPHAWTLDEAVLNQDGEGGISLQGMYINQYACGNELYSSSGKVKMGHGVFCHEFSHCMGLPDMYDTNYGSTPTMEDWDLLASGSYNGPAGIGWCPAGWTSWERQQAGWLTPVELQENDTIKGMSDLQDDDAQAYIIYNDAHKDEFYLLENHTNKKWDAYVPEDGLLVIHVDYDRELFDNNIVNTKGTFTTAEGYSGNFTNDHPRMAPFSRVRSIANETYYYTYPIQATRGVVDSLTNTSKPATTLFNDGPDGTKFMSKPIYDIKKDAETGSISFVFMPKKQSETETGINETISQTTIPGAGVKAYGLTGKLIGNGRTMGELNLPAGIYIIEDAQGKHKVCIQQK